MATAEFFTAESLSPGKSSVWFGWQPLGECIGHALKPGTPAGTSRSTTENYGTPWNAINYSNFIGI